MSAAVRASAIVVEGTLSFDEVFAAHAPYVARSLRCLGVPERELEDACQEVFVVVARRLGEVEPRSLRGWMYGICLRKALASRRSLARRREDGEAPERTVDASQEESVERRQRLERALRILDGLSDEARAVFVLYEVEQLSMAEIAALAGCPVQTAYARLYAARRDVEATLKRLRARKEIP